MIYTHTHWRRDLTLEADLCVIGTGAGGAPVAHEATKRGKRVILLEAGSFLRPQDFTQLEHEMFPRLFHEKGGRGTADKAVHIHQGKGVGGSTLHNLNLCKRLPPEVEQHWREQHGLKDLPHNTLQALMDEIEQTLSVSPLTPAQMSSNNRILKRGVEALGYRGGLMKHNRVGCVMSGFCELGCAFDAKQNALKVFIPPTVKAGAMVLADTWAVRLLQQGRKVEGVEAVVRHPDTGARLHKVTIKARAVCVSASATGTAALLQRSEIPDPYRLVGSRLFIHPAVAVGGLFHERLESWRGIPQSYECTEYLDFSPGSDRRVWLIPAFAHPVGVASIFSGFGPSHERYFKQYPHMAAFTAMLHDEHPGRVEADGDFGVKITYWPDQRDQQQLLLGLRECARLMQAAGAHTTLIPFAKTQEIGPKDDIDQALRGAKIRKHDLNITAVHPMGTVWMGDDPKTSCVTSRGRYHHMDNLFVADTSLFPTSIGTAPQITTYTLGLHVGRQLAALL